MAFKITYVDSTTGAEIATTTPKEHRTIPSEGQYIYLSGNGQSLYRVAEVRHNYQGEWPHTEIRVQEQ